MRGRKPNTTPRKTIETSLPTPLIDRLNEHLKDPITGRRALFDRSQLIEKLIRDYLNKVAGITLDDLADDAEDEALEDAHRYGGED